VQHFVGASARLRPGALYHSHGRQENRQEGVISRIQLSLDEQKTGRACRTGNSEATSCFRLPRLVIAPPASAQDPHLGAGAARHHCLI